MRNLELLNLVELCPLKDVSDCHCMTVDCDTGTVYCATSTHIVGFDPKNGEVTGIVRLTDEDYLPADGSGRAVGIQYLADQQSVCLATNTGNLIIWSVLMGQLECVGAVDSGFTSMTWSPDLELLILTTGQDTFIMMTREFDPIVEKSLHPEDFGEAEFVTVGWGKKETQFHGSEGKEAAKRKTEEVKPALAWDDKVTRVSWRGDGQYFVTSTVSNDTGARKLRVWSRECEHQSTSENVDGVEQALAWKPSGSIIAGTMRRPNKHDVIFFEKNGLRHGEFSLPFGVKDVKVLEMCWNLDSTVLMIWCEDLVQEPARCPRSYVQCWVMGNYHWYRKQTLSFNATPQDRIVSVIWDPEVAYRMHVINSEGKYMQYTWSWATHCSSGANPEDQTIVAVIDGDRVLMTPMKGMVVPPPMSAYYLQLPCSVNGLTFCRTSCDMSVLLADGCVAVYTFSDTEGSQPDNTVKFEEAMVGGFAMCCTTPRLKAKYKIDGIEHLPFTPLAIHHLLFLNSDLMTFCTVDSSHNHSVLHSATFQEDENSHCLSVKSSIAVEGLVYKMAVSSESGHVAIQLTNGAVFKFDTENDILLPWETSLGMELVFPVSCPQMYICEIGGEEVVLGLTDRYRFYVNDIEVASNCTSFAVHKEFLLLTTLTHTCRCISRHTKVQVLPTLSDGKAHPFDESVRRVERGSRIVCVIPDDTKLVLQMPRGNLEAIHPRALILSYVRDKLDKLEYSKAMTCMRKHRINLNLIYDHNPVSFLGNVNLFVKQVNSVSHVNLFLTDLREEDCTVTMYTAAYNRIPADDSSKTPSKINSVCDAVKQALINLDQNKFLLSILTSYVRKSPPELEAALMMVKTLRDNREQQNQAVSAEEVLKYLLFLVDVNEMFDVALGTYDFDLVLMVAEKSQKDPKEYIPFLNTLRRLEGHYQQYTIDKHLKRFSKALVHISKCGPDYFEECKQLTREHGLYTEAIQLFAVSSQEYKQIAKMYGEYLSEKKRHGEAGIVFIKAEEWLLALQEFQACLQWRQVFCMTARLKYTPDAECDVARKLADQLKMKKQYADAAQVLDQYAKDVEEAIVCLVDGCHWDEALRLMYKSGRTDFIETNLIGALTDNHSQLMESLESSQADFDKYRCRLSIVRTEKEKARLEFLESGGDINRADADLFSDTSSATGESIQSSRYSAESGRSSLYSKSSGRSSRNRRKAEQKKWKLKEGSQYEDFALIAALSKLITAVDGLKEEIGFLTRALLQFHFDDKATELQQTYELFLSQIEKAIPDIWPDITEQTSQPMLGPMATANSIAQAVQRGQTIPSSEEPLDPIIKTPPALNKDSHWKLKTLEKSSR